MARARCRGVVLLGVAPRGPDGPEGSLLIAPTEAVAACADHAAWRDRKGDSPAYPKGASPDQGREGPAGGRPDAIGRTLAASSRCVFAPMGVGSSPARGCPLSWRVPGRLHCSSATPAACIPLLCVGGVAAVPCVLKWGNLIGEQPENAPECGARNLLD